MLDRLSRAFYRIRQFFRALKAKVEIGEAGLVCALLSREEQDLFFRMPPADQRHSLDVLYSLMASGQDDADLLKAALLHDIGKTASGHRIGIMSRVLVVLTDAVSPKLTAALASSAKNGWRRDFYLHVAHERLAGELLRQAGTGSQVVALVQAHESLGGSHSARLLHEADEAN